MKSQKKRWQERQQSLLFQQKRPVVTEPKAILRGLGTLMGIGILLTGTILFYVWSRVEVVRLNYAILEVSRAERKLFMQNERLKVELAQLLTPSRLSSLAKNKLNLKDPSHRQIIYIK